MKRFGLSAKVALMAASLVMFVVAVMGRVFYTDLHEILHKQEVYDLEMESEFEAGRVESLLGGFKKDALLLSKDSDIRNIIERLSRSGGNISLDKTRLAEAENIRFLLDSRRDYLGVRLISLLVEQEPTINIHKNDKTYGYIVEQTTIDKSSWMDNWQSKTNDADYVYLSDIHLLRKNNRIVTPETAVIKAFARVYGNGVVGNGEVIGLVEVTMDVQDFLFSLDDSERIDGHVDFIVNSQGNYLKHYMHEKSFAFERGSPVYVYDEFPGLGIMFSNSLSNTTVVTEDETGVVHMKKVWIDEADNSRFIGIVELLRYEGLENRISGVINKITFSALLLVVFSVFLSVYFSRLITRPVKEFIAATAQVAAGNFDVKIPMNGSDELGRLARSFNQMIEKLRSFKADRSKLLHELNYNIHRLESQQNALDEHAIVSIADDVGKIVYANERFCEVSQYTMEELIGSDHSIVNSGCHDREFWNNMWRTIGTGKPWHGEIRNRKKDGSFYWVDTTIMPFLDERDIPYQYVSIRTDITKLKQQQEEIHRAQDELHHAQKMKAVGTLAGGIAHDFNNILMGILNYAELCQMDADEKSEMYENLTEIIKGCDRAQSLIDQILSFSRKKERQKISFNPVEVTAEVIKLLSATLPATITIDSSLDTSSNINMDPISFHQVMMNICVNASHAMGRKAGKISVLLKDISLSQALPLYKGTLDAGDYVLLSIRDSGSGIPEDILPNIFDPFFTTKEVGKGTGLGLAEVYGIIMDEGGGIVVDSYINAGTRFDIYIPVDKSQAAAGSLQQSRAV